MNEWVGGGDVEAGPRARVAGARQAGERGVRGRGAGARGVRGRGAGARGRGAGARGRGAGARESARPLSSHVVAFTVQPLQLNNNKQH